MARFYDHFLAVIEERYPRKQDLANALMEVLRLEKESTYRRLRKDVYFSVEEVMRIAEAWNISLDNIVGTHSENSRPFHFKVIDYADPKEADYRLLEQYNRAIATVAKDPGGRMFEVLNSLAYGLYIRSEHLARFFTMKWLYKYAEPGGARPFCDIHIPERMRAIHREHIRCVHSVPEVHSIHDRRIIENLVGEIAYFRSIGMLTGDETTLLRGELLALVEYLENVTTRGTFPSGNRMFFYLSHMWLDTEYVLYESRTFNLSLVKVIERNSLASMDMVVSERLMNMVQSIRRSSVLMSESNVLQQAEFFARQREIIMTL